MRQQRLLGRRAGGRSCSLHACAVPGPPLQRRPHAWSTARPAQQRSGEVVAGAAGRLQRPAGSAGKGASPAGREGPGVPPVGRARVAAEFARAMAPEAVGEGAFPVAREGPESSRWRRNSRGPRLGGRARSCRSFGTGRQHAP